MISCPPRGPHPRVPHQEGMLRAAQGPNCQQKKLLRAATVKAQINAIHMGGSRKETKPINGLISFPLVNPNKVIVVAPKNIPS